MAIDEKIMEEFVDYAGQHGVLLDRAGFNKSRKIIEIRLKGFMAQQLWKSGEQYPVLLQMDNTFQEAYRILKSGKKK